MEHRAGIEPANTGFADQRVSHFATGALVLAGESQPGGNWVEHRIANRIEVAIRLRHKYKSPPRSSIGRRVERLEGEKSALETSPRRARTTAGQRGRIEFGDAHLFRDSEVVKRVKASIFLPHL